MKPQKKKSIERMIDSLDTSNSDDYTRIKSLSIEERKEKYKEICARINEGRRLKKLSWLEASSAKDIIAQVYDIHPNQNDIYIGLNLLAIGTVTCVAGYYIGYEGIIKPIIEHFSR